VLPSFSIVIPSHHRADLLTACLRSVCSYAPPATQIIVVDDGSINGSISRAATAFEGVEVIRNPSASGFCKAANRGIAHASGEIVQLLNDDTEVMPGWAEQALRAFADPRVGAAAPLVTIHSSENKVDSAGDRYYWGGIAAKRHHRQILDAAECRAGPVFGASGSSAFLRRAAFVAVGGFPESFGSYFEDVDLAFRLHRAGYSVLFEPGSRVTHRVSASFGRPSRRLLEQQSLNEERVFWRNLPWPALAHALPHHLAVLVAKAWIRWRDGGLAPFLTGRMRILGEIENLRRHRRWLDELWPLPSFEKWQIEKSYWGGLRAQNVGERLPLANSIGVSRLAVSASTAL
jgi:GT2 family glycosyltransferase